MKHLPSSHVRDNLIIWHIFNNQAKEDKNLKLGKQEVSEILYIGLLSNYEKELCWAGSQKTFLDPAPESILTNAEK